MHLPFLTTEVAGAGGVIREQASDFVVEEVPRYEPCGEGTHTFFQIEKTGLTTHGAIRRLSGALHRSPRQFGYAGLKDARALTRQTLSIEHVSPEAVMGVSVPGVRVCWAKRHGNKLKMGHLAGNRFEIRIRDVADDAACLAERVLARLESRGVPNYFGVQRFGRRGTNAAVGRFVLMGDPRSALAVMLGTGDGVAGGPDAAMRAGGADAAVGVRDMFRGTGPTGCDSRDDSSDGEGERARGLFDRGAFAEAAEVWRRLDPDASRVCRALVDSDGDRNAAWLAVSQPMRKLYVNAAQSALFNAIVARRISELDRVVDGDVAYLHRNGACFAVEDARVEQPRCDDFEISATGPMFGAKMKAPGGEPARMEAEVLGEAGLVPAQFVRIPGVRVDGTRRPIRVPVIDVTCRLDRTTGGAPLLVLGFRLPPGAYATSVLREVMKNDSVASAG